VGGNPTTGIQIFGNDISDAYVWEEPKDLNHHNGIYMYAEACHNAISGEVIHDNYIHGDFGVNTTAFIFNSCTGGGGADNSSPQFYNNVLVASLSGRGGPVTYPDDAFITTSGSNQGIYNNTIVGMTTATGGNGIQQSSCNVGTGDNASIANNIVSTVSLGIGGAGNIVTSDHNDLSNLSNNAMYYAGHFYGNVAAWSSGTGFDVHSSASNPALNSDDTLSAKSPAVSLGTNLTSLGIPGLDVGAPQTFGANYACGTGCQPRPSSGAWDAGAYEFSTNTSAKPEPPVNLDATVD
jgi:hypothetical protein